MSIRSFYLHICHINIDQEPVGCRKYSITVRNQQDSDKTGAEGELRWVSQYNELLRGLSHYMWK